MKPQLRNHSEENFDYWARGITRLAEDTNACCKLSGLVTEADNDWSLDLIKPYTDHLIQAFGCSRIMWGSDWPVVRLKCEYEDWFELSQQLTAGLTEDEKQQVFATTASDFYRL